MLAVVFGGDLHPALGAVQQMTETAYSREQEREADDIGLRAVFRTYGSLDGAFALFELLAKQEAANRAGRLQALGATHPFTSERLAHLREEARRLAATPR
jgi:predicted Zn-dependent protease